MEEVLDPTGAVDRMYEIAPVLGVLLTGCIVLAWVISKLWKELKLREKELRAYADEYKKIAKDDNTIITKMEERLRVNEDTRNIIVQNNQILVSLKEAQEKRRN